MPLEDNTETRLPNELSTLDGTTPIPPFTATTIEELLCKSRTGRDTILIAEIKKMIAEIYKTIQDARTFAQTKTPAPNDYTQYLNYLLAKLQNNNFQSYFQEITLNDQRQLITSLFSDLNFTIEEAMEILREYPFPIVT